MEPPRKEDRPRSPENRSLVRRGGPNLWFLVAMIAVLAVVLFINQSTPRSTIETGFFLDQIDKGNVAYVKIGDTEAVGAFENPPEAPPEIDSQGKPVVPKEAKPLYKQFRVNLLHEQNRDKLVERLQAKKVRFDSQPSSDALMQTIWLIAVFLPLGLLIFFWISYRRSKDQFLGGGFLSGFSKSPAKRYEPSDQTITFANVAGLEGVKADLQEIVDYLKSPEKFQRLGGRVPKGVLLNGAPGTGKTLLARAVAGEAGVPFYSVSASEFIQMFVGVGASRVRDLFKQAKDNSPCIIFLDEIDAVGRRRGSGFSSGGHDEREQTLNAILVEMDGFETNDQVIVCAATNRVDVLDPALTRPGRFDRQVFVGLPDVKGRFEILKVHARKVKLGSNVDLLRLARATPGFSGADLAAIINESALGATMTGKEAVEQDDLEEARDKVRWGRARKSRVIDEKDKIATAYHEAGHAVVQYLCKDADPIHKVTILPRGNYGGATMALPEKDRTNYSRSWCIATMKTFFAGRISEEMFSGDINTGATGDIRQASNLARRMVRDWGMNQRLGFVYYGDDDTKPNALGEFGGQREYSEETARMIDEEVKSLIDVLYDETRQIIETHRDKIDAVAKALMKYETLDSSDLEQIMKGGSLARPTMTDLIEQEHSRPPKQASTPASEDGGTVVGGGPLPQPG